MKRLVIANRGEIARRILRSARERGYEVAVVSTASDADALVRLEADAVLEVPSFLDAEAIVAAASEWKASLLHPGYGFLSENADFAERVETAGIVFVGPVAETMRQLGNKERAKALAIASAVPTLPALGSAALAELAASGLEKALVEAGIEAPYLVKAAGGGGGRGMRIVEKVRELPGALERASEEARAGFSDPTVFVERYLPAPRHVEIQVVGDGEGGGVFLGERECSMQRRYQKVLEEAPSPVVDPALREAMGRAALALVERTRYRGAGTVEFLLDAERRFYFLEVNTRLQVEHPVTEIVYDVDLVGAQLELAEGSWPKALASPKSFSVPEPRRWAIEARVLAEDPRAQFLPTPGPLKRYREPAGVGVRVDSGVSEGGRVNAEFDSMIAKVIGYGDVRASAIARLSGALERMIVHGATTNLPFLQALVRHPDFRSGSFATSWIGEHLDEVTASLLTPALEQRLSTAGLRERLSFALRGDGGRSRDPLAARFESLGNGVARVGSPLEQRPVSVLAGGSGHLTFLGEGLEEALAEPYEPSFRYAPALIEAIDRARREPERLVVDGVGTAIDPTRLALTLFGETLALDDPRALAHRRSELAASDGEVRAPMSGKVLELRISEGDAVSEGDLLAVVESMKMQLEVHAETSGRVERVHVQEGDILDGPDPLATIVPDA